MFTKASNSFKTISILSAPIPVEITVILLFLYLPVVVLNSLLCVENSIESKCCVTLLTLSGSPTKIISLEIFSGFKFKW